jgi:hypothetical protein
MTFQNMELVSVFVFILAGLMLLQLAATIVFLIYVDRGLKKAEKVTARTAAKLRSLVKKTQETLARAAWVRKVMPSIESSVLSLLDSVSSGANKANKVTSRELDSAFARIDKTAHQFEFALTTFTRQTNHVRRVVRYPAINAAALLQGLLAALRTLRRPEKRPLRHLHDGESFI